MLWSLRTRQLDCSQVRLMGILNVTPDSFSDGGRFLETRQAIQHGLQLVASGADILDVGGESTRPYSEAVDEQEELSRVQEVVRVLASEVPVPISIDTSKWRVAQAALDLGAEIINDVTGFRDPDMVRLAADSAAGLCVMHMQGTPQTMQDNPDYDDVVTDVYRYLASRRDELVDAGIALEKICLDPGVGFGKTHEHNFELLARASRFLEHGTPILVGHSRKGFIAKLLGDKQADRTVATVAASLHLAGQGVHVLRVHDVEAHRQALQMHDAILDGQPDAS